MTFDVESLHSMLKYSHCKIHSITAWNLSVQANIKKTQLRSGLIFKESSAGPSFLEVIGTKQMAPSRVNKISRMRTGNFHKDA